MTHWCRGWAVNDQTVDNSSHASPSLTGTLTITLGGTSDGNVNTTSCCSSIFTDDDVAVIPQPLYAMTPYRLLSWRLAPRTEPMTAAGNGGNYKKKARRYDKAH